MRFLASILALVFTLNLSAQNDQIASKLPESLEEFTSFFNLNHTQVDRLVEISDRKTRQLQEIKDLKSRNLEEYIDKRIAINKGFNTSISLMLTQAQKASFNAYISMIRKQQNEIRTELSKAGKSEQEIKLAIVEN